jgi:hypothetical protein
MLFRHFVLGVGKPRGAVDGRDDPLSSRVNVVCRQAAATRRRARPRPEPSNESGIQERPSGADWRQVERLERGRVTEGAPLGEREQMCHLRLADTKI